MKKTNLFIIGTPKTGTTALHYFLNKHPDICMSYPKDIGFFCKDSHLKSDQLNLKKYPIRTLDKYKKCFKHCNKENFRGETSNHYFHSNVALDKIRSYNPNSKIILLLREPVDHLISLYYELKRNGLEKSLNFEEAILKAKNFKTIPPYEKNYYPVAYMFDTVKRCFGLFSKENIKVILFEDFKNDNRKIYIEILDFLKTDHSFLPQFRNINCRHKLKFKFLDRIIKSKIVWKIPKLFLPLSIYLKIKEKYLNFIRIPFEKEKIDKDIKNKIKRIYLKDVESTGKIIGIDLISKWNYKI